MAGLTPKVSLKDIIRHLFQNEQYNTSTVTFAHVTLCQQLVHPAGFTPLNVYIYYQVNETVFQLISFAVKDEYIYGFYFNVENQKPFTVCELTDAKIIKLDDEAIFTYSDYFEFYTKVNCTPIIVGLNTLNGIQSVSVQYASNCRYYYTHLNETGIIDPIFPLTHTTGLSRSLKCLLKK